MSEVAWGSWSLGLAVGGGLAGIDFDRGFDDELGLAGGIRGMAGIVLGEHVGLEIGAGTYIWGYPGETVAYGTYGLASLTMRF